MTCFSAPSPLVALWMGARMDGRVCYIPGHLDPPSLRGEGDRSFHHPRLTPNSINVHERLLQVRMDDSTPK